MENALQICGVPAGMQLPKSHEQGTAAQDTNPQINLEQVFKHLLLQNLVQLRMFAGAERAPPAAEA